MGYKNDLIGIINLKLFICLFICRSSSSTRPGLLSSTTSGLYNSPDYKYKNTSVSSLAKAVSEIRNYSTPWVSSTYRRRRFYYWSAAVNKWFGILCVLFISVLSMWLRAHSASQKNRVCLRVSHNALLSKSQRNSVNNSVVVEYFWKFPIIIALWECCGIVVHCGCFDGPGLLELYSLKFPLVLSQFVNKLMFAVSPF